MRYLKLFPLVMLMGLAACGKASSHKDDAPGLQVDPNASDDPQANLAQDQRLEGTWGDLSLPLVNNDGFREADAVIRLKLAKGSVTSIGACYTNPGHQFIASVQVTAPAKFTDEAIFILADRSARQNGQGDRYCETSLKTGRMDFRLSGNQLTLHSDVPGQNDLILYRL